MSSSIDNHHKDGLVFCSGRRVLKQYTKRIFIQDQKCLLLKPEYRCVNVQVSKNTHNEIGKNEN